MKFNYKFKFELHTLLHWTVLITNATERKHITKLAQRRTALVASSDGAVDGKQYNPHESKSKLSSQVSNDLMIDSKYGLGMRTKVSHNRQLRLKSLPRRLSRQHSQRKRKRSLR